MLWDVSVRLVHWDEEVSGGHTTLSCLLGNQEEVITLVWLVIFYKNRVDNGSWLRILHFVTFLHKDSLVDSFINHYQSNLWNISWVEMTFQSFFELRNLIGNNHVSHSFADTISIYYNLIWCSLLNVFELSESFDQASIQVFLHNFLIFGLYNDIWVEGSAMFVGRSRESNDWIFSLMANINTDDHHFTGCHEFRKLNSNWLSTDFGINLLHYVWSNRHVEFSDSSFEYALRKDVHA